ncbi:SGNH/GDSL hydrolase family protein [Runella slithyformis]|uniref:SGNH hydrolase-type esterase domain-containing protein n=1 Tax=Runella slithyformis (strain ATCC 29530 / DSM 19594 / LMG 11500 / NCIMB 11436 / LSU 4) TaxID=761193 RepID=A0A7U3ZRF9_RUNSL|nr:SGNH/GDSL hydrolase family protein [Runella slithyformis]AEI52000.1 hypothetical protein Runsl_5715 [Runella slithyformis DSM 19594]
MHTAKTFRALAVSFFVGFSALAQSDSLARAVEATYRAGLPNFFTKINKGKPVKIAYLGGSITRADNGWRQQTFDAFQKQYPNVRFEEIMAAIGGTGSDFGAYRLEAHVLQHAPDLVFVEFAVNDNGKMAQQVKASMEGIVRQIWRHTPKTDICFVYTFQKVQLPLYEKGRFPVSASAMEAVAEHYQIPTVCMGLPAIRLILEGKMIVQGKVKDFPDTIVFSEDGVHPYPQTGQKVYAETLVKHFNALKTIGKSGKHALKKALIPENLEKATLVPVEKLEKSAGWTIVDSVVTGKPFASLMPPVYASADTSQYLKVSFAGRSLGLLDIMGPSSGQIQVWIDNDPPRFLNRFDEYCTYYRMGYSIISGLPGGKHTAILKVSPVQLDKAAILEKRNNKINNPQSFRKHVFYPGAVLVEK